MAVRKTGLAAAVVGLVAGAAFGQPGDAPDLDFLEYLGSWQDSDEEWLIVAEMEDDDDKDDDDKDDADKKRKRESDDDDQ